MPHIQMLHKFTELLFRGFQVSQLQWVFYVYQHAVICKNIDCRSCKVVNLHARLQFVTCTRFFVTCLFELVDILLCQKSCPVGQASHLVLDDFQLRCFVCDLQTVPQRVNKRVFLTVCVCVLCRCIWLTVWVPCLILGYAPLSVRQWSCFVSLFLDGFAPPVALLSW